VYADYQREGDHFDPLDYVKCAVVTAVDDEDGDGDGDGDGEEDVEEEEEEEEEEEDEELEVENQRVEVALTKTKVRHQTFIYFSFVLKHRIMFIFCLGI
jgi:hypothetical protein